ncbi:MAG: hypothetical protein QW416_03600 [Candidatus Nitrosocaldaceae archaeon]
MINEIMEDLYKRIEDSGELGIRRTQLIKEFGKNIKTNLDELLSQGFISLKKHRNSIIYYANKNIDESRLSKPIQNDNQSLDKINYIENESDERMHNLSSIDEKSKSLSNENSSITNMLSSLTNRIDTLTKDNSNSIQDIHSKLNDLANKFDELVNLIERKADKDALVDVENNINKSIKMLGGLESNLTNAIKDTNEMFERLQRQIGGKADDIKLFEMEKRLENLLVMDSRYASMERLINELDAKIKAVKGEMEDRIRMVTAELSLLKDGDNDDNKISLEQFKMEFDRIVAEHTNSIGWIELIDIRKRICSKYNISKNTFYTLVSQLLDAYNSYELSSGGKEGIVIRGLTHGFVRMI